MCRRSPPACDRRHIRQPGPAARFTAVLPRGSGGDTGGARRNRQGLGDTAEDRCSGVRRPRGWSPGTGGSGLAAGGAGQGRGRPPPATRRHLCPGPLRHCRSGPGLSRSAGGCSSPAPGGRYCRTWERPGGQPRAEGPEGPVDAAGRPRYLPDWRPPAPESTDATSRLREGRVRLRATVSTDAGTRVRMMRTRSARPRTIRSASPVGAGPRRPDDAGALAAW